MPFDGSGNYVPAAAPSFPAVAGTTIVATYYNNVINDIADALSNCLTRDNQGKPTGAINWNQNFTALAGSFTTLASSGTAALHDLTLTTPLGATYGGTGLDAHLAANGQLLIGNASGFSLATLTAGAGISITNGAGSITIAATGGGGAGTTSFPLTVNNGGAGTASAFTFDGSAAKTLSWNSIGAKPDSPRIQSVVSAATVTPTFSNDQVNITAQAASLSLANPTGTAVDGWGISIRIKDNGTARSISYGTKYRAIGVLLPSTTVVSKTLYLGMIYNLADDKWDVVAVQQQS